MAVNTSSYRDKNTGRYMKGNVHKRFYPKTSEAWINWYIGESENRTIQRIIRSDIKNMTVIKQKPSKCLCHHINYHNVKTKRTIYNGISKSAKSSLSGIFNKLDLIQSTRKRVSNRVYHNNNIENESLYHKKRNAEIRQIVLMAYTKGNMPYCVCCNACHIDALALDHINGGGNKHRKSLSIDVYSYLYRHFKKTGKWLSGYQILCITCNWIKYTRGSCDAEYHKKLSVGIQTLEVI